MSIPQIVDILARFKSSMIPREQQIFKCMIHNLFDEYQFFPRYPDKELAVTSILFGSLIQSQIISGMALGVALRYVLDALRHPLGSKLFNFASQALFQFQSRLPEWPQYCSLLLQIPHLHQAMPDILQKITRIMKQQQSSSSVIDGKNEPNLGPLSNIHSKGDSIQQLEPIFSALQLNSDMIKKYQDSKPPSEAIQDKILFVINNLSFDNMEIKATELRDVFSFDYYKWFSTYIVKRASLEPNFHSLYSHFLDKLSQKDLYDFILEETLSHVYGLLNSEKTLASSQERTTLKNLGTWLGMITLAKNRPIRHKNLAVKELLLEGYDSSRLIVVIPFVCKILEQGHESIVFSPPNPWLMAIMRLLSELYRYASLKLNLKFEVEVLCKKLQMDLKDITPTDILRNRPLKEEVSLLNETDQVSHQADSSAPMNIAAFINFNPNIPLFNSQPSLKRIVHIAIDRAIREVIMSPVVERSVAIATIATRELILKDFALEGNEDKMRKSSHLMVQSLSGIFITFTRFS